MHRGASSSRLAAFRRKKSVALLFGDCPQGNELSYFAPESS